ARSGPWHRILGIRHDRWGDAARVRDGCGVHSGRTPGFKPIISVEVFARIEIAVEIDILVVTRCCYSLMPSTGCGVKNVERPLAIVSGPRSKYHRRAWARIPPGITQAG